MPRIITFLLIIWTASTAHAATLSEPEKISRLLHIVETSDVIFIRQGKKYNGAEARQHLERKLKAAGKRDGTARDFIRYIASRSSRTGETYYVKLPDGKQLPAGQWLGGKLDAMEATREP
jgi:hypothetical protein